MCGATAHHKPQKHYPSRVYNSDVLIGWLFACFAVPCLAYLSVGLLFVSLICFGCFALVVQTRLLNVAMLCFTNLSYALLSFCVVCFAFLSLLTLLYVTCSCASFASLSFGLPCLAERSFALLCVACPCSAWVCFGLALSVFALPMLRSTSA